MNNKYLKIVLPFVTACLLVCIVASVKAQDKVPKEVKEKCETYYDLAETLMTARQNNVSLKRLVELAEGNELIIRVAILAYEQPIYLVEKNKENAIAEFSNNVYLACYSESIKGHRS